jgi:transcriptional regulator with XRE-family HTH domain
MDAGKLIRDARRRAGLTLRQLGEVAGTSHSTLSAYESGRTTPTVATLDRILGAAGFAVDVTLVPRIERAERGHELAEVLDLAAQFPARHAAHIEYPKFGVVR